LAAASALPLAGLKAETLPLINDVPHPPGPVLESWTPGWLEIHHISTGRGNATLILCPDGTTLLIDAGAQYASGDALHSEKYLISPKPDASKRPGQWIARYIERRLAHREKKEIDCFILTHLHTDHMGGLPENREQWQKPSSGKYVLTGVMDVHEQVPIRRILDRGYPDYNYPVPLDDPHQLNYRAFIQEFQARGGKVEQFHPGSTSQVHLNQPEMAATFGVQNLAANGVVWNGTGGEIRSTFPTLERLAPVDYPNENMCSVALRLAFGAFGYYAGGDLVHETQYGRLPWADIESAVARACGRVDVAAANHHGYVNGCGPEYVRRLRPRAFVINAWDSAHPTIPSLDNMLSKDLYPAERDVYATALKPENIIATKRLAQIQSGNGHVIVRVPPDAKTFNVVITTNANESDSIVGSFGPYECSAA
jgi:glyoxylase-like metal-dependent hydrolase (beta-lactamase superfamily II)